MTGAGAPATPRESETGNGQGIEGTDFSGTDIFGDEREVTANRALALPLVAALVAVGVIVGVAIGVVAVVTAPVWTVAVGSLVPGNQEPSDFGTYNSSGLDAAILLDLPDDAVVLETGDELVDGQPGSTAQVSFDSDPAALLENSGYSAVPEVPQDLLAQQGADFGDPRFFVAIAGDIAFTALVGTTSDGQYLVGFTGPVFSG